MGIATVEYATNTAYKANLKIVYHAYTILTYANSN